MKTNRTSPNWQFTVDHHSEEGRDRIARLREEVQALNSESLNQKWIVKVFGRCDDRRELEKKHGVPEYTWRERCPPLGIAPFADVYIYPDYRVKCYTKVVK